MSEIVTIVAVIAAALGGVVSTIQGYFNGDSTYSVKKLGGALIGSIFAAFGLVNLIQIPEQVAALGYVGLIITNLLVGYGIDKAITKAKS